MTAREWNPGDLIADERGVVRFVIEVTANSRTVWKEGRAAVDSDGNGRYVDDCVARPLVVIDPEDREQVERLADLVAKAGSHRGRLPREDEADGFQAALREFANPTPPKPEEPTGLGAVVEDAEGEKWLRWEIEGRHPKPWTVAGAVKPNRAYADITAVRVLSEGVTA